MNAVLSGKKKSLGFLTQPSDNKIERFPGKKMQFFLFLTMAVWCRKWPRCHFLSSLFCVRVLSDLTCLFACTPWRIHKESETWASLYSLAISELLCKQETGGEGQGEVETDTGTMGRRSSAGDWGGVKTWGHIKSIQLKHELQGSLSISKPMKVTIHQKRVPWRCCKASCGHTRTHAALRKENHCTVCTVLFYNGQCMWT